MEYCVYSSFAYVSSYEHGSGKSPTKNRKQIDINDHIIKIIVSDIQLYFKTLFLPISLFSGVTSIDK
eukprot:Pgem_evm1s18244